MLSININWLQFFNNTLPWVLPLLGGLILLLIGPFTKSHHRFHYYFTLLVGSISLYLAWDLWLGAAQGVRSGLFLFDQITYFFVLLFLVALLLVLLLSYNYLEQFGLARFEYYALLLMSVFGMGCMAAGHDLMAVFLGLEVMSVSLYILAGFQRSNSLSVEASLKYFLMGAFASSFLLLGIAFIYGASGTTDLFVLFKQGAGLLNGETHLYALIGITMLSVGFAFKIGMVPFHFWVSDVYEGSPIVVTTFMATAVKAAGFAALLRVVWALFQWSPELMGTIVSIGALLTMTVGNVAALVQKSVKRMLAYSSVAHAGYAVIPLVAFGTQPTEAVAGISFYLLAYMLMTVGAFAVLIALTRGDRETCQMKDLSGLGFKKPFLGFVMTVFMLSLAGMPPTIGFFGKYYLFIQAINAGFIWLVVAAVINSVISVYYYLTPVVMMYFGKEESKISGFSFSQGIMAVLWLTFLGVLFFGLFPSGLLQMIQHSAATWIVAGS